MKKTNSILLLVTIFTASLIFSCQKEASVKDNTEKVIVQNVLTWLENQRLKSGPVNSERIQLLSEHLDLSSVSLEKLNDNEKLVIIPLSGSFRTINNKEKEVVNVFAMALSGDGTLKDGRIVQYAADNGRQQRILPTTIAKLYNRQKVDHNGKYRVLTIADRYLYEVEYRNGVIYSLSTMRPKDNSNSRLTVDGNGCIDWYIVTTITYSDGTTWTYEEFVGRTCGGCFPNDPYNETEDCGEEGGSGSGGGGETCSQEENENFINQLAVSADVSPENESVIVEGNTGGPVTKKYKWRFYKVSNLFNVIKFVSTETAVINGWNYESIVHTSVEKISDTNLWDAEMTSFTATPTVQNLPNSAPITQTMFGAWATMRIKFFD